MTDSESKRTEYLWANMSLGEQLDDLARRVAELESGNDFVRGQILGMSGRLSDLEGSCSVADHNEIVSLCKRVEEIEIRDIGTNRHLDSLDNRVNGLLSREVEKGGELHALHGQAAGWRAEWCYVRELARLRRIEEAARGVSARWMLPSSRMCGIEALRSALDSEPKR